MGIVNGKRWKTGDSVAQQDLNDFATNLGNAEIDDNNTASNWATEQHFDAVNSNINEVFFQATHAAFSTSSTTWTTVANTSLGNIMPAESGNRQNLVRVQYNGLTGEHTAPADIGAENLYAYRVKVQYSNGASDTIAYSINKFTSRTWSPISGQLSPDPINWRPISGSGIVIPPVGVQITDITLEAIVYDATNTSVLERVNLIAVLARA